jgi:hypothetical protein
VLKSDNKEPMNKQTYCEALDQGRTTMRCEDCGETFLAEFPLSYPLCDPCDEAVRAAFAESMAEGPVFGDELADAWEQEARA